jgi:hypothetical protein
MAGVRASAAALPTASAGESPHIHGTVRDSLGVPLPHCVLTLLSAAGDRLGRGHSEDDGSYDLPTPGSGSYILVATSPSLGAKSTAVLVGREPVRLDLRIVAPDTEEGGD